MPTEKTMYIELKSGYSDNGPAWIGRVKYSKTGRTAYFNGRALKLIPRGGISGNYSDIETGQEYWITGVKKRGSNRHPAGGKGPIQVDSRVVTELLELKGWNDLDRNYDITEIADTNPADFYDLENSASQ